MNTAEKRRAELLVEEWKKRHPVRHRPEPTPNKQLADQITRVEQALSKLYDMAGDQGFAIRLDRYHSTGRLVSAEPVLESPAMQERAEAYRADVLERFEKTDAIIRRIWTDDMTFEELYKELPQ